MPVQIGRKVSEWRMKLTSICRIIEIEGFTTRDTKVTQRAQGLTILRIFVSSVKTSVILVVKKQLPKNFAKPAVAPPRIPV